MIGFEGLGTDTSLDSLRVIVFDKTCDIENPDGVQEEPVVVPEEEID